MNSFNLYLSSESSKMGGGYTTNFHAPLNDSRINQDNFEVALAQISFTDTETIDMGSLIFTSYMETSGKPKISIFKIEAKMGESYALIFERLVSKVREVHTKNEFERRKLLRSKNLIKENEMYYDDSKSAIAYKIILPNKDDNKLDDLVLEQIKLLAPSITLEYYLSVENKLCFTLLHKLNSLNHVISYKGNITTFIPTLLDKIFNEISGGPQHIILESEKAPDMSLLFLETDLIENNHFSNEKMKILKYFSTKSQSTAQVIDFSSCLEYKQLSYKETNERDYKNKPAPPSIINISLMDNHFKNIYLNSGTILVNLHFRKKL